MRKLIFTIFLVIGNMLYGQDLLNHTVHSGDISPLNTLITISQLHNFSKNDLRILRNTIYAKYGYIFSSGDLQEHFSQFSWYNGITVNVDDKLTILDKENIELIQKIEKNYPANNISTNKLIGDWYNFGAVSAEGIDRIESLYRNDRISILPNGIYVFYPWRPNIDIFYGLWFLSNNTIEMIPIGEHINYHLPTYGRTNGLIDSMQFNDGTNHLAYGVVRKLQFTNNFLIKKVKYRALDRYFTGLVRQPTGLSNKSNILFYKI